MHECLSKLSRNSLSKFESTGHLHLCRVGRKQVDIFNASPPCYHQIKTSRQVDTFNASPPYHQIKAIHRPCRNICTYTCIHASKRRLRLCARCSRGGRWLGLIAINTATILASAPMHAEAPVPPPTLAYISMCHPLLHRTPPSPPSVSMCPLCSSYTRNQ